MKIKSKIFCHAGHDSHDRIKVKTKLGLMYIYDWNKYKDFDGYCIGQDDVSRTIRNTGEWAWQETQMIKKLLKNGDRSGLVLDFGCHVGWYSILAAKLGYSVIAIDGVREHCETLKLNAKLNDVQNKIAIRCSWIDKNNNLDFLYKGDNVFLLKADIEGSEEHVIKAMEYSLERKLIQFLYLEISPIFNKRYPALVQKIADYGYHVLLNGKTFNFKFDFRQENLLFIRE